MRQEVRTEFAEREGTRIAYRIFGTGSRDLVIVPGIISHVEYAHELPGYDEFIDYVAPHFRVIIFDKRGNGLSQKIGDLPPTLEQRMDDIRFVMDAANSKQATIMGVSEGGSLSALFAAMYPDRTERLILFGAFAHTPGLERLHRFPAFMHGFLKNRAMKKAVTRVHKTWGDGSFCRSVLPSRTMINSELRRKCREFERASTNASDMGKMMSLLSEMDVTSFLKDVRCPTLVMHSHDDRLIPFRYGEALHEGIEDSELIELSDAGHTYFMSKDKRIADAIISFAASEQIQINAPEETGRVLATVMFNDIVGSTRLQVELGDEQWRIKIRQFEAICKQHIQDFDGIFIKGLGDGVLAVFSGPARAIRCALTIKEAAKALDIKLRTGLHVGEIEKDQQDISGINVNLASRIQSVANADQVLVSDVLKSLAFGSGLSFQDLGDYELKGFDGKWRLSEANTADA